MDCVIKCDIYYDVLDHLEKVRNEKIDTKSGMQETINAVFKLSQFISFSDSSHSVYIHNKVDEYIKIFQAVTRETIKRKNRLRKALTDFKKKKEQVFEDLEMYEYLKTFCNVITSVYRT